MFENGYVRLTYAGFQALCLQHLISGVDEDGPDDAPDGASATAITGYTEWISSEQPMLTIGWDWQMLPGDRGVRLRRESEPRSNVMLQSPAREDLGAAKTTVLLETIVDSFDWQTEALAHISDRYQGAPRSPESDSQSPA
ncbi:MAG: DUF4902 domain-containing protein [Pseudomonadota bacterium]